MIVLKSITDSRQVEEVTHRRSIQNVVSSVDIPAAGTTYSVRSLCRATAEAGCEVDLVSLKTRSKDRITEGVSNVTMSEFPINPYLGHLGRRLGYSRELFDYCKSHPPALLHLHGMWMLPNVIPGLIAIKQNTPYIVSPHGSLGIEALRYSSKKKRAMIALGQGKVLKRANCLRATAPSEAEAIRAFGLKQPIALIPNGIDIPDSTVVQSLNQFVPKYVLWIGRMHPIKGLPTLIRAWNELANKYPDWTLRLVGTDEIGHKDELRQLINEMHVPRISIEEPVFGDEKTQLMANAQLFVLSSQVENFAMTVAESLSLGVPVISSKGAPWAGLTKHQCGWWVDGNVSGLSSALEDALNLPESERRKMGVRGKNWMKNDFAWEGIGRRMVAVYDWVLGRGDVTDDIIFD